MGDEKCIQDFWSGSFTLRERDPATHWMGRSDNGCVINLKGWDKNRSWPISKFGSGIYFEEPQ
jgi:hypothetical protein